MSNEQLVTTLNDRLRSISLTLSGIQAATPASASGAGGSFFVIPPRSITPGHFANTLKAILLVATLLALPNSGYPEGTVVFNEADGILYHVVGGAWTTFASIPGPGSITTTMIAPNAITTPLLAALSVTSNELASNSVIAGKVAAGAIRASDAAFATAAIQDADIHSLSVSKLSAGTITTAVLTVSNVGGVTGIITDITQASDPALLGGSYTGISIQDSTSGGSLSARNRISIGPYSVSLITSSGNIAAYMENSSGYGVMGVKTNAGIETISLWSDFSSTGPLLSLQHAGIGGVGVQLSVNSSGVGQVAIAKGFGSTYYAPWVNANGKRMVWGVGIFSSGAVNIATGLTTVEHFSATVANASAAEALYITGGSGGTVNTASTLGSGSSGFDWFAIGT